MIRGLAVLTSVALLGSFLTACSNGPTHTDETAQHVSAEPRNPPPKVVPTRDLPPNDGPNILVVTTDDMRWDELRYVPNVRKYVASRGLRFSNSFAPNPLCCPSRASFLTGQYSHNHGVYTHEVPYGYAAFDDHLTVGTALNTAGYQTALVGKYLNGYGKQPSMVTGGPSATYVPDGWTDWMVSIEKRWPVGSPYRGGTYNYQSFTQNVNGKVTGNRGTYSSVVVGDQVQRLVRKYDAARETGHPWFIWATPVAPHFGGPAEADDPSPYRTKRGTLSTFQTPARPDWVKGWFDDEIKRAPGVRAGERPSERDVSDKPDFIRKLPDLVGAERRALLEVQRQRAEALFAWDRQFGRIVRTLKKTGQYQDTVIVFTSDNGYFTGEHRQRSGKIKPYEPSLRVPLVVAGPGIPHGVREAPVTTIDVTATILDLAGASLARGRRVVGGAGVRGRPAVVGASRDRGQPAPATRGRPFPRRPDRDGVAHRPLRLLPLLHRRGRALRPGRRPAAAAVALRRPGLPRRTSRPGPPVARLPPVRLRRLPGRRSPRVPGVGRRAGEDHRPPRSRRTEVLRRLTLGG